MCIETGRVRGERKEKGERVKVGKEGESKEEETAGQGTMRNTE